MSPNHALGAGADPAGSARGSVGVESFHTDYGAGYEPEDAGQDVVCDWVEDDGFAAHPPAAASDNLRIAVVDGTMRTEARLTYVDGRGNIHTGLAGSWAAGAVLRDGNAGARIGCTRVSRMTVFAGGKPIQLPGHRNGWRWSAHTVESAEPEAARLYLQRRMRDAEGRIAERLCEEGWFTLIDGPLHNIRQTRSQPVAGYVKTHRRRLFAASDWAAIPSLAAGERSGLFALGEDRYACYLRVGEVGPWATPWAGIARIELDAGVGRDVARQVAERLAACLPAFASPLHRDARAPVNLVPIAGLERHLHRLQGDPRLALRAVRESVMALNESAQ